MNLVIVISSTSGCLIFFYNCVKKVCIENKNTCTLYLNFQSGPFFCPNDCYEDQGMYKSLSKCDR